MFYSDEEDPSSSSDSTSSEEGEEKEDDELLLLRETVRIMNRILLSNAEQFTQMATRIEKLENALKRKHADGDDDEEEPIEGKPYVKQKIIIGEPIECKGCNHTLDPDSFDMTSSSKKDSLNNIKVYQYRRSTCKDCIKAKRKPTVKRKNGQINTF